MKLRRLVRVSVVVAALLVVTPWAAAQRRIERKPEDGRRPGLPVLPYTIAVVCGAVALWSVLRSSRRGWSE